MKLLSSVAVVLIFALAGLTAFAAKPDKAKTPAPKKKEALDKLKAELEPTKCHETCTAQSKDHADAVKKGVACIEKPDCDAFAKCMEEVNKEAAKKK